MLSYLLMQIISEDYRNDPVRVQSQASPFFAFLLPPHHSPTYGIQVSTITSQSFYLSWKKQSWMSITNPEEDTKAPWKRASQLYCSFLTVFFSDVHLSSLMIFLPKPSQKIDFEKKSEYLLGDLIVSQTVIFFFSVQLIMTDNFVGEWVYIPEPAFHYFPQGQQIIVPNHKKPEQQWRKIFGGGQYYSPFENNALEQLEKQLVNEKKEMDPFFTKINKLRFLQANKFKVEKTIESMQENTKWRKKEFPIHSDPKTERLLASGAFYFCGRDSKYRPILVVDIGKFEEGAEEDGSIQKALVVIMEFMINQLLIEGQVENYCIVMDLDTAGFGNRGIVMDILSFTSNAYRGRLFVSYLLSMPTVIRWGWDGIVSNFISENTRRKIKITGDSYHNDMWTHIDRNMIQHRFGGDMPNIHGAYWPPKKELLLYTTPEADAQNRLVSSDQYFNRFKENRLENRKILRKLVQKETKAEIAIRESIEEEEALLKNVGFRTQTQMEVDNKVISTFFQFPSFQKICHNI